MIIRNYIYWVLLCHLSNCVYAQVSLADLSALLVGQWKVEGKASHEQWHEVDSGGLDGLSYRIKAGEKQITEYIKIRKKGQDLLYSATVINHNNGQEITFVLDQNITDRYEFHNPQHDFPNTISYQFLSADVLFVQVTDLAGKGFSYRMNKQDKKDPQ